MFSASLNSAAPHARPLKSAGLLAAMLLASLSGIAHAADLSVYGHIQGTAETYDRGGNNGLDFDRVRLGTRYAQGPLSTHVQIDFNAEPTRQRQTGTVLRAVQLAFASWQFDSGLQLTGGQFKTPLGMDFNKPGADLDISKRGLDAALTLNRAVGLMLSQRNLPYGLGFDIGLFGPAGRSAAVFGVDGDPFDQEGEDFAGLVRLHLDPTDALHFEAAAGRAENAGGADNSSDYDVFDIGARYKQGPITLAAEYIEGHDVLGTESRDQSAYYLHAGWQLRPRLELVGRHYQGNSDTPTGDTRLQNTYYGVNLFLGPDGDRRNLRLQVNYLDASGDESNWNGVGGFTSDAWLVQLQLFGSHQLLN